MLNRRHLRIKILQSLYAYFQSNEENYAIAEKRLFDHIEKIYDLYLYLLLSFGEIKKIAEQKLEENKGKLRPSKEDLNPNRTFIDNSFLTALQESEKLKKIANTNKVSWVGVENHEMFKKIFSQIQENESYLFYMEKESHTIDEELHFIIQTFKEDIANSPYIFHFFEEKSIHWMDDIDLACSMVIKTIKSIDEKGKWDILPLYKDEEDEKAFVKILFRNCILLNSENELIIDELTMHWELDRIAKMDVILMKMAITELIQFPEIPINVSLNEYIEISKFYSTPKSNAFINGILDKAIDKLKKEGKIKKIGKGLLK
ncbi:MAG: transcription antitermination protein NusB [Flavobacteriia bacterium]|nr:transcription antitermination protein NusB [Flavobacteriia bacterium]